jgi:cell division protein FtsN
MRDVNPRSSRERFDLSLDGRQIASVVVGSIVVLAVVFVLGLNVGKQIGRRELPERPTTGGDALAALDQAPVAPGPAVRDESLTYHDRLVKERPAAPVADPAPAATPAPAPTPPPPAPAEPSAAPVPAPAPAVPPPTPPVPAAPPPAEVQAGEWCVQLGAANDRGEAERIAAKFERFKPRIEVAILQGKTWYRVRVGSFAEKPDAERFLKDLARETGAKGFVTAIR